MAGGVTSAASLPAAPLNLALRLVHSAFFQMHRSHSQAARSRQSQRAIRGAPAQNVRQVTRLLFEGPSLTSSPFVSHPPFMYGIVGVVFVSFLVRFAFITFMAYLNIGVSSLNPSCSFVRGANRCGEPPRACIGAFPVQPLKAAHFCR